MFNIGADQEFIVKQLADVVLEVMEGRGDIRYLDSRNELEHVYASHEKAKSIFNIGRFNPLEKGINKMVHWAKKERVKLSRKFENIEITENLPSLWLEG